jgi:hypothetical protein
MMMMQFELLWDRPILLVLLLPVPQPAICFPCAPCGTMYSQYEALVLWVLELLEKDLHLRQLLLCMRP